MRILPQNHRSLVLLSALWLALCASLVLKHRRLIMVFFAFCGSFLLAAVMGRLQRNNSAVKKARKKRTYGRGSSARRRSEQNTKTKHMVGLVACTVSFYLLSTTTSNEEYTALSVMAGFLAFDHWYSNLYCQPPPKALSAVTEDALSLTIILCVLSIWDSHVLQQYRSTICAWLVYKTLRLSLYQLDDGPSSVVDEERRHLARSGVLRPSPSLNHSKKVKVSPTRTPVDPSLLWTIHGQQYDLQDFVEQHPGGREAILLGRDRDCTALFESYHPFTQQHKVVLDKYQYQISVRKVDDKQLVNLLDSQKENDFFYNVLRERVSERLRDEGIDPKSDRAATPLRTLYYGTVLVVVAISGIAHLKGSTLGSFVLALSGWLVGALGHDAGHFAAFRTPWLNDWAVWAMSLLCNPVMWQHQHTYAHHSHTNEFDRDPDLHHFETFLRVHQRFRQRKAYRYQANWLFVAFAYTFVVFGTCFWIPWGMIQEGSLYGKVEWTDRKRPLRTLGLYCHLAAYVAIIMVTPFWSHSSWLGALGAVVLHVSTSGIIFSVFSQINHLNELSLDEAELQRRAATRDKRLTDSWAVSQVETSNNFAPDSVLWHVLSNGLNYQIEHHLFPSLNHCHLHHIAPVVRRTCDEFGVCYKSYDTWSDVMRATLDWLERLSDDTEQELIAVETKSDEH